MKYSFFIFLLFHFTLVAQDSTRALSNFEKFYSQKGTMIKIESNKLGSISNINVSLQRVSNMENGQYKLALVLTQIRSSLLSYIGIGALYIDYEELEGVQKALNYYLTEVKSKKTNNDPSYIFTTLNNIVVSCSYVSSGFVSGWYVSLYQRYEYIGETIPNSTITVRNKDIDDLVEAINKAKNSITF